MTHFVGVVVADSPADLPRLLERYDENREVEEHFVPYEPSRVADMAQHYELEPDDIVGLKEKMEDWVGRPGAIRDGDGALGMMTTYNPESKWDWYVLGGRWDGAVPFNVCLARDLELHLGFVPNVLVDEDGWHATVNYGWFGTDWSNGQPEDLVKRLLEKHADRKVYVVDFHGA